LQRQTGGVETEGKKQSATVREECSANIVQLTAPLHRELKRDTLATAVSQAPRSWPGCLLIRSGSAS
jgi:hypothetical protein